jgi:hypothetical protein
MHPVYRAVQLGEHNHAPCHEVNLVHPEDKITDQQKHKALLRGADIPRRRVEHRAQDGCGQTQPEDKTTVSQYTRGRNAHT